MPNTTVAEILFDIIPLLKKTFVKPVAQFSQSNLSPMQVHVLILLKERPALTMTTLASEMHISKQQLTPIIEKLVAASLAERQHDQIDRRIIRIALTDAGLNALQALRQEVLAMLQVKLSCLDAQDLTCLEKALTDLHRITRKLT